MATARPTRLTLRHPPLDELVIGVQFRDDVSDDAVALADYWPRIRDRFPAMQKQPSLPAAGEDFGAPSEAQPTIELLTEPPAPRYWFISENENLLVQLQPNRFFLNWRKRRPNDQYPRYTVLRDDFRDRLGDLLAALPAEKRANAVPTWCEVTYINHVEAAGADRRTWRPLSDILRLVSTPRLHAVGPPEDTQLQQRHIVTDSDGHPAGRLYITAVPALSAADRTPIYVVTLLARLGSTDQSVDGVMTALDHAHTILVDNFKAITRPRMHAAWGLEERND